MNCPICKAEKLEPSTLNSTLAAQTCPKCAGHWIDSANYWKWLEELKATGEPRPAPETAAANGTKLLSVNDSGPGKFCPGCGRFLTRAKPGHGLDFFLNRCAGCGGIWLDANEWENLKSIGLHDDIHFIFSDSWQAEAERTKQHEQLLAEKLGDEALTEIKRIKTWLDSHPKRAELYAYLIGPKDAGPSKR